MVKIETWKLRAAKMRFEQHKSWGQIASALASEFPELDKQQVYEKVRRAMRRNPQYKAETKQPEKQDGQVQNTVPKIIHQKWGNEKIVRFAMMGDTHINSKFTQLTHLHDFYDICQHEGIETVYHAGDIDDGEQMRKGHQYECYTQGVDDHVAEIVRVYPKRDGITTHFITGNHDASIMKLCGYNIGYSISREREDMVYEGADCAIIEIAPKCRLELRHPWDGTAYSISYKTQKMIEAMPEDEKPEILGIGNYHKQEWLYYRDVHSFQTGCFEAQTPFMRGKGIAAIMGGWIMEIYLNDDGSIRALKPWFIPYSRAIKEDYKNFR